MFGGFAAFAGIDGDMLEMLFVAPQARGKGVGRQLVEYLVRERGIRRVEVNEQNAQAAGFYARLGFAALDDGLLGGITRDRKSTRLNSSHITRSRMPSSA